MTNPKRKKKEIDGRTQTAPFFLTGHGFSDNYSEADLMLAITTTYLMVNFLEAYPPVLANLEGNRVVPDWPLVSHKDQFECCYFAWPLKGNAQFSSFFNYARTSRFGRKELLDRFCFIEASTGTVREKNGSAQYLLNGLGYEPEAVGIIREAVGSLKGYLVCWPEFPDERDYRTFLSCIEANESFTKALNLAFGELLPEISKEALPRKIGRPRQRDEIAKCYMANFPNGHAAEGLAWKDAARIVAKAIGRNVTVMTLTRGIREMNATSDQK